MSQVLSRRIGEKAGNSPGSFTKMLDQSLLASTFLLDHLDDYLRRRLKISQLLSLQVSVNHQVPDLLHILDLLLVRISLDLGQLFHSICVMIHNIGQISHQVILFQKKLLSSEKIKGCH